MRHVIRDLGHEDLRRDAGDRVHALLDLLRAALELASLSRVILLDERLQGLGAQRIGEIWIHDASSGTLPETEGAEWCRQWLAQVLASTETAS